MLAAGQRGVNLSEGIKPKQKHRRPWRTKAALSKKNKAGGTAKMWSQRNKSRILPGNSWHIGQRTRPEHLELNPQRQPPGFWQKCQKHTSEKKSLFHKWSQGPWVSTYSEWNKIPIFYPAQIYICQRLQCKTWSCQKLQDVSTGKAFLERTLWRKFKSFCTAKKTRR